MRIKGWKKVLKFTYIQNLKSKSFIVSTIIITAIFMLIMLGINFVPDLLSEGGAFGGESSDNEDFNVKKVYILDESRITPAPDFTALEHFGITTEIITSEKLSETTDAVYNTKSAEILIHVTKTQNNNYDVVASRPFSEEVINSDDCNTILAVSSGIVNSAKFVSLGVSPENINAANSGVSTHVTVAGETPKSEIAMLIGSIAPIFSSIILFIFIFSYGALVAQSIAMEKTSRVMELLLTSVKPLAVIIGKVLAMGLVSITQIVILSTLTSLTVAVTAPFGTIGKVLGMIQVSDVEIQAVTAELSSAFSGFNAGSVVWIVIIFVLGFLFYALLAGLVGATVSRAEDMQSAMQPLSLVAVFGFYLSYMGPIFSIGQGEDNILTKLSLYIPISSPFALPSAILLGKLSLAETFISVGILAAFVVIMVLFVAKVYESVIMHTGDRLKFGSLFKMLGKK